MIVSKSRTVNGKSPSITIDETVLKFNDIVHIDFSVNELSTGG